MSLLKRVPEVNVIDTIEFDQLQTWDRFDGVEFSFGEMDFSSIFNVGRWGNGVITFDPLFDKYGHLVNRAGLRQVYYHQIYYALTSHSYVHKASDKFRERSYQVLLGEDGHFYCPELER